MKRFEMQYPVTPWVVNQPWGIPNDIYKQFGFTRHNGVDVAPGVGKAIYAPVSGTIVRAATKENGEWQPNGGGVFVSLISDEEYLFDDGGKAHVLFDFLHCEKLLRVFPDKVRAGEQLAIADNTGFSTGPHTHIQSRRCNILPGGQYVINGQNAHLEWVDRNEANNSFDFVPYLVNQVSIEDIKKQINAIAKIIELLKPLVAKVVKRIQK